MLRRKRTLREKQLDGIDIRLESLQLQYWEAIRIERERNAAIRRRLQRIERILEDYVVLPVELKKAKAIRAQSRKTAAKKAPTKTVRKVAPK